MRERGFSCSFLQRLYIATQKCLNLKLKKKTKNRAINVRPIILQLKGTHEIRFLKKGPEIFDLKFKYEDFYNIVIIFLINLKRSIDRTQNQIKKSFRGDKNQKKKPLNLN